MDYHVFDLVQVETGTSLYSTTATQEEILDANNNLKQRAEGYRFYPQGTFRSPRLHGAG